MFCNKAISPYVLYVPSCECGRTIKNPMFDSILCRRSLTGNYRRQLIRYCQSEVGKTCSTLLDLDRQCSHESHERVRCRARRVHMYAYGYALPNPSFFAAYGSVFLTCVAPLQNKQRWGETAPNGLSTHSLPQTLCGNRWL